MRTKLCSLRAARQSSDFPAGCEHFSETWLRRAALGVANTLGRLLLALLLVKTTGAATFTVSSIADNGPGSLRAAIANAADGDTINFGGRPRRHRPEQRTACVAP